MYHVSFSHASQILLSIHTIIGISVLVLLEVCITLSCFHISTFVRLPCQRGCASAGHLAKSMEYGIQLTSKYLLSVYLLFFF